MSTTQSKNFKLFNIKAIVERIFSDKDEAGKPRKSVPKREDYPNFYIRLTEFFNGSTRKASYEMLDLFHKQAKHEWRVFDQLLSAEKKRIKAGK